MRFFLAAVQSDEQLQVFSEIGKEKPFLYGFVKDNGL